MFSLALTLDPAGRTPMYEQLYGAVAGAIREGTLRHGEKLPSKRALCASLGVSRSTVETAYELLLAEGYVESRPRSGYYVAEYETAALLDAPSSVIRLAGDGGGHLPPRGKASTQGTVLCIQQTQTSCSDTSDNTENRPLCSPDGRVPSLQRGWASPLSTSAVDVSAFPYASWAKLYKEVVYNSPELLQRGDPRGEAPLRAALARTLSEYRGVRCAPEQRSMPWRIRATRRSPAASAPGGSAYASSLWTPRVWTRRPWRPAAPRRPT